MARTVLVGDVHGCARELDQLLSRVALGTDDDLVFVGDLVARGPDTLKVLDLFRQLGARSVCGNHEQRLLQVWRARRDGRHGPRLGPAHYRLLHQLRDIDWATLEALPLFLDVHPELRVVHAGVIPGVPIEDQEAWTLLHARSLDARGRPSERSGETSWARSYTEGPHVVFGHDSRRGLAFYPRATCLDSGCVYGHRLSALVIERGARIPSDTDERASAVVSVPAEQAYYRGVPI